MGNTLKAFIGVTIACIIFAMVLQFDTNSNQPAHPVIVYDSYSEVLSNYGFLNCYKMCGFLGKHFEVLNLQKQSVTVRNTHQYPMIIELFDTITAFILSLTFTIFTGLLYLICRQGVKAFITSCKVEAEKYIEKWRS